MRAQLDALTSAHDAWLAPPPLAEGAAAPPPAGGAPPAAAAAGTPSAAASAPPPCVAGVMRMVEALTRRVALAGDGEAARRLHSEVQLALLREFTTRLRARATHATSSPTAAPATGRRRAASSTPSPSVRRCSRLGRKSRRYACSLTADARRRPRRKGRRRRQRRRASSPACCVSGVRSLASSRSGRRRRWGRDSPAAASGTCASAARSAQRRASTSRCCPTSAALCVLRRAARRAHRAPQLAAARRAPPRVAGGGGGGRHAPRRPADPPHAVLGRRRPASAPRRRRPRPLRAVHRAPARRAAPRHRASASSPPTRRRGCCRCSSLRADDAAADPSSSASAASASSSRRSGRTGCRSTTRASSSRASTTTATGWTNEVFILPVVLITHKLRRRGRRPPRGSGAPSLGTMGSRDAQRARPNSRAMASRTLAACTAIDSSLMKSACASEVDHKVVEAGVGRLVVVASERRRVDGSRVSSLEKRLATWHVPWRDREAPRVHLVQLLIVKWGRRRVAAETIQTKELFPPDHPTRVDAADRKRHRCPSCPPPRRVVR